MRGTILSVSGGMNWGAARENADIFGAAISEC
jgi:hypothetical protein